jgi:transcriptional regulator with GAF, ATPase, and Fis domain
VARKGELFLDEERAMHGLIGRDPEYLAALTLLKKVAPTPASVLLIGESGTGKELFARAIHALSTRKNGPFVPINCAAIPETLLESELFGHEKGAFTGADSLRIGKLERAGRGTLFLDEIGEMKTELQAKLLRFLQSGEIERVGGSLQLHLDVRVIAATHQDLARKVENGSFRQDLYFRLNVFQITLPPLRKRKSDIQPLAAYFYRKYAALLDLRKVEIDAQVHGALENYEYPGNVRELENIVYRSLLLSEDGDVNLGCLPEGLRAGTVRDLQKNPFWHLIRDAPPDYEELCRRKEQMKEICRREIAYVERRFAEGLVTAAKGNVSKAAQMAGIDRGQFHRLLKSNDE